MMSLFAATVSTLSHEPTYAVGWGTLALLNAGLAQSKFRSGAMWFVVSLLLGPLATLILVVLDRMPDPRTQERG